MGLTAATVDGENEGFSGGFAVDGGLRVRGISDDESERGDF